MNSDNRHITQAHDGAPRVLCTWQVRVTAVIEAATEAEVEGILMARMGITGSRDPVLNWSASIALCPDAEVKP